MAQLQLASADYNDSSSLHRSNGSGGGRDDGWRAGLRAARRARRITQQELAFRAGVSLSAVRAYETGLRRPSAKMLRALVDALGLPGDEANRLIASGYQDIARGAIDGQFAAQPLDALRVELTTRRWPAFITNQAFDVVAANEFVERVFGVDSSTEYTGFGERNLFSGMAYQEFASRCLNWDQMAKFVIGLTKGDPRRRKDDDSPLPWLESPLRRFMGGEPALIKRFLSLWDETQPLPHRLRQTYRFEYLASGGAHLMFHGVLALADLETELHWNEWIPADQATWAWLEV